MREIGFQPNAAARSMRTNVTKTIGLLIPDILSPTFARVAAGAESVLMPAGYILLIGSSNRSIQQEVAFLQTARQRRMDGLIVSLSDETARETLRELGLTAVPKVVLDRDIAVEADVIHSEHRRVMEQAASHLISLGHRRIGYVGPSERIRPSRERVAGYREAHAAAGVAVDERLIRCDSQNVDFGEIETTDLLAMRDPPTALIGGSGDIFVGVMRALRTLGVAIPGTVSLIGVDDPQFAELVGPPVTSIARDMVKIGGEAAKLVLGRIADPSRDLRRLTLPSALIMRHSTVAPPAAQISQRMPTKVDHSV
jgi:LacI family transcriptional regulator